MLAYNWIDGGERVKKIVISGLIAGVAMLVVLLVLNPVFSALFPELQAEYQNSGLFRPWSDPLMSLILVHPFVLGIIFAWIWSKSKSVLMLVFLGLPGMLISYSTFPVSLAMVISWSLSGLIQAVVAGLVLAKLKA